MKIINNEKSLIEVEFKLSHAVFLIQVIFGNQKVAASCRIIIVKIAGKSRCTYTVAYLDLYFRGVLWNFSLKFGTKFFNLCDLGRGFKLRNPTLDTPEHIHKNCGSQIIFHELSKLLFTP